MRWEVTQSGNQGGREINRRVVSFISSRGDQNPPGADLFVHEGPIIHVSFVSLRQVDATIMEKGLRLSPLTKRSLQKEGVETLTPFLWGSVALDHP